MSTSDEISWNNFEKAIYLIDAWQDSRYHYALILYPNGVLHLQWMGSGK